MVQLFHHQAQMYMLVLSLVFILIMIVMHQLIVTTYQTALKIEAIELVVDGVKVVQ